MKKIILLALLLCGCGSQTDYTFIFEGPETDLQHALNAAAEWNRCRIFHTTIIRHGDGDARIRKVDSFPGKPITKATTNGDLDLITYIDSGSDTMRFLAHEMGHVMGIRHEDVSTNALMTADPHAQHVTDEDCGAL